MDLTSFPSDYPIFRSLSQQNSLKVPCVFAGATFSPLSHSLSSAVGLLFILMTLWNCSSQSSRASLLPDWIANSQPSSYSTLGTFWTSWPLLSWNSPFLGSVPPHSSIFFFFHQLLIFSILCGFIRCLTYLNVGVTSESAFGRLLYLCTFPRCPHPGLICMQRTSKSLSLTGDYFLESQTYISNCLFWHSICIIISMVSIYCLW